MEIVTRHETNSASETFEIGRRIGESATPGMVYTLIGDLGVGKTVLTQGVDYTLAYRNNRSAGTAMVKVTGIGNCVGSKKATFNILPVKIGTSTFDELKKNVIFAEQFGKEVLGYVTV